MNDKNQDPSSKVNARRRLIRGAFAAPAVMTLYSGGAFAASSHAARCIANKVNGTSPSFPDSPAPSTWLRVQRYKLKTGPDVYDYYVRGQDIIGLQAGKFNPLYLSSTEFQKITGDSSVSKVSSSPTSGGNLLKIDTGNYVAVRVDNQGKIVGIVGSGINSATSAVAGTCWSSFVVA